MVSCLSLIKDIAELLKADMLITINICLLDHLQELIVRKIYSNPAYKDSNSNIFTKYKQNGSQKPKPHQLKYLIPICVFINQN